MRSDIKRILIRTLIMMPVLVGVVLLAKPMISKAWTWYKPWTWPFVEDAYYAVKDFFFDPNEDCPADDELMARVMVEGEKGEKDFYSQTAIAWNYVVARALEGKKVIIKLEATWRGRYKDMRTQYPSPVEGGHGSDRAWLVLHQYDMGADMRKKDIPYLNSSSKDYVDSFQDGGILVPEGCDITLDLNGNTIDRKAEFKFINDGEVFHVKDGATLTIIDSNPTVDGDNSVNGIKIYGGIIRGGSSSNGGGAIQIKNGGTVYIEGGTFCRNSSSDDGGAINIDGSNANLFIDNVMFMDNRAMGAVFSNCFGGAITCEEASAEILNSKFYSNDAEYHGGAVFVRGSQKFTMTNCIVKDNTAKRGYGGGIYLSAGRGKGTRIEDTSFINNSSGSDAGALYISAYGKEDVFGTLFEGNTSEENGGAVSVNHNGACFSDCMFKKNKAKDSGGGIFIDLNTTLSLKGKTIIKDNKSDRRGTDTTDNVCVSITSGGTPSTISNAGLTSGSKIGINTNATLKTSKNVVEKTSRLAAENYFEVDDSQTQLVTGYLSDETASYVASMIGGDMTVLIILSLSALAMIVIATVVTMKRRGA